MDAFFRSDARWPMSHQKMYQRVKRIQDAMTPATIMSSFDRFLRIFSTRLLIPGILPIIFPTLDWTLPNDRPCVRKSDLTSLAWATTDAAEFNELLIWFLSRSRCSIDGSAWSDPAPLAPSISWALSFFRTWACRDFSKSPDRSKRISRYRFTSRDAFWDPTRSLAGWSFVVIKSCRVVNVLWMSWRKVASSSFDWSPASAKKRSFVEDSGMDCTSYVCIWWVENEARQIWYCTVSYHSRRHILVRCVVTYMQ